MILMIFEVISIMVIVIGYKVLQNPTLVFWLGHHMCRVPRDPYTYNNSAYLRDISWIKI